MRNGNANTACVLAATVAGANNGHRDIASGAAMSPATTGSPLSTASTAGPSPRVRVNSSNSIAM